MDTCEVCGNRYDKMIQITTADGARHTFDSFECAIHAVAPRCAHCSVPIVGHGIEADGRFFCCAHCAEQEGVGNAKDRVA